MHILSVFGTRPEAIKMALLSRHLATQKNIKHTLCVTAQHREMLDQVLNFFQLKPYFDLNLMQPGQDLASLSARVLTEFTKVLKQAKPDLVCVHGDTTTSCIAAIAAFYLNIKVAHIEAGMRTYNLQAPFPEEANRTIIGRIAHFHFAPTAVNKNNLLKEGVSKSNIIITGNTVIDALLYTSKKVKQLTATEHKTEINNILSSKKKVILVTAHRRESFGSGFVNICKALKKIARELPDIHIIYPVHLNPQVQDVVNKTLKNEKNILLIKPLSYPDFVFLLKRSWIVLTDSGGIQEEAPSLGKPVLVMRETTERPEAVKAGVVKLTGTDSKKIFSEVKKLVIHHSTYKKMSQAVNPYGDGKAVTRIIQWIKQNRKRILS
ncbi:MAG: non-hydrolyzing UDP-N-acetylglucosamine 2-epimerase [Chitinophagales bacterium]